MKESTVFQSATVVTKGQKRRKVFFYARKGKCTYAKYESEPRERKDTYVVCTCDTLRHSLLLLPEGPERRPGGFCQV